jgi:hypothetical protein
MFMVRMSEVHLRLPRRSQFVSRRVGICGGEGAEALAFGADRVV